MILYDRSVCTGHRVRVSGKRFLDVIAYVRECSCHKFDRFWLVYSQSMSKVNLYVETIVSHTHSPDFAVFLHESPAILEERMGLRYYDK